MNDDNPIGTFVTIFLVLSGIAFVGNFFLQISARTKRPNPVGEHDIDPAEIVKKSAKEATYRAITGTAGWVISILLIGGLLKLFGC